jgi:hypothetical protein
MRFEGTGFPGVSEARFPGARGQGGYLWAIGYGINIMVINSVGVQWCIFTATSDSHQLPVMALWYLYRASSIAISTPVVSG